MLVTNIRVMDRWTTTHEALQQAALTLFQERGFDATSTAEVAKRAGVSEMTLFRHFPTKAALLLHDPFDATLAEAVRSRPAEEPAMQALTEAVRISWRQLPATAEAHLRLRLRILAAARNIDSAIAANNQKTIAALTEALIDRGVTAAKVAATALMSGLTVALLEWSQTEQGTLDDALTTALNTLGGKDHVTY